MRIVWIKHNYDSNFPAYFIYKNKVPFMAKEIVSHHVIPINTFTTFLDVLLLRGVIFPYAHVTKERNIEWYKPTHRRLALKKKPYWWQAEFLFAVRRCMPLVIAASKPSTAQLATCTHKLMKLYCSMDIKSRTRSNFSTDISRNHFASNRN